MSQWRGKEKGIRLSWEQPENLAVDDRNSWKAGITDGKVSWSSEIARMSRIGVLEQDDELQAWGNCCSGAKGMEEIRLWRAETLE